jgi:hypothetical protein
MSWGHGAKPTCQQPSRRLGRVGERFGRRRSVACRSGGVRSGVDSRRAWPSRLWPSPTGPTTNLSRVGAIQPASAAISTARWSASLRPCSLSGRSAPVGRATDDQRVELAGGIGSRPGPAVTIGSMHRVRAQVAPFARAVAAVAYPKTCCDHCPQRARPLRVLRRLGHDRGALEPSIVPIPGYQVMVGALWAYLGGQVPPVPLTLFEASSPCGLRAMSR